MAENQQRYVEYDPDVLWDGMQAAWQAAGGDVLYPGDEKEMFARFVLAETVKNLGKVDAGLRMGTLRGAIGTFLDDKGEDRKCYRIRAKASKGSVILTAAATGQTLTLPAGTQMTPDGRRYYALDHDVTLTGFAQTMILPVTCTEEGALGNGVAQGTQMQLVENRPAVVSVIVADPINGGDDTEDDESYRERIRTSGASETTTGPYAQYRAKAMGASSRIVDAEPMRTADGEVGIYLILEEGTDAQSVFDAVLAACAPKETRPLTDKVHCTEAETAEYVLKIAFALEEGAGESAGATIQQLAVDYQKWQESKVGRPFNPDKLVSAIYNAGAIRVVLESGSRFGESGAAAYTEVEKHVRCCGTIELAQKTLEEIYAAQ